MVCRRRLHRRLSVSSGTAQRGASTGPPLSPPFARFPAQRRARQPGARPRPRPSCPPASPQPPAPPARSDVGGHRLPADARRPRSSCRAGAGLGGRQDQPRGAGGLLPDGRRCSKHAVTALNASIIRSADQLGVANSHREADAEAHQQRRRSPIQLLLVRSDIVLRSRRLL